MTDITIKCVRSIHEIPEADWDGLQEGGSFFNSHRFIRSVEEAAVEDAAFEYVLFYRAGVLIGHTVISAFNFTPDLFVSESKISNLLHRVFPSLMNITLLTGGVPASLGQLNMVVADEADAPAISHLLADLLDDRATQHGARFVSVKELTPQEADCYNPLQQHGFVKVNSIPYMMLDIQWPSFDAYLGSMRHPYRRSIHRSLKKIDLDTAHIYLQQDPDIPKNIPVLVLGDVSLCPPATFHALYLPVMARTSVKLETLNAGFFDRLYDNCKNDLDVLVLRKGDHIISAALLVREGANLTFMLIGRKDRQDMYDSYYNLVYGIIAYAIQTGVTRLNLGQTSYWVKQRIGGVAEPRFVYFKATGSQMQKLVQRFHPNIFPETPLPAVRVFLEP